MKKKIIADKRKVFIDAFEGIRQKYYLTIMGALETLDTKVIQELFQRGEAGMMGDFFYRDKDSISCRRLINEILTYLIKVETQQFRVFNLMQKWFEKWETAYMFVNFHLAGCTSRDFINLLLEKRQYELLVKIARTFDDDLNPTMFWEIALNNYFFPKWGVISETQAESMLPSHTDIKKIFGIAGKEIKCCAGNFFEFRQDINAEKIRERITDLTSQEKLIRLYELQKYVQSLGKNS
ncbi:MAG: hypothetical protein PHV30_03420 [Candidatus Margulisbacteria bacterium]|nr:hypothetical protein [Candidatus Margulisiibacteriota bacterium]